MNTLQVRKVSGPKILQNAAKEVKIAYDSFIENREVLSWNIVISSKMSKRATGGFQCMNCQFSHELQHFVIDHIEMNHLPKFPGYRCTLCKLLFQTWFIFKNHVNKIHCSNISLKTGSSTERVPIPVKIVQRTQPLQPVKVSPVSSPSSWSIVREAGLGNRYQCRTCMFTDSDKAAMLKHCESTHSPAREHFTNELADMEEYTCDTCSTPWPNQTAYIEHKRRAHKQIVKPYKCELCEYRCLRRARLIHHLAAKHNLYSGQRKTRNDRPRSRTDRQPGVSVFQCSKCQYSGGSSADLRVHEYKHHFISKAEPDCVIDGVPVYLEPKQEAQWSLNRRLSGPKYHCRYCLRSCSTQEAVTDHEMTHGGVHQYNCEFCNKGFRQRIRWIQHMDKHHRVSIQVSPVKRGIYTCRYCERDLPFKKTLNEHMISEHGFSRQSKELLPDQFRIGNVKMENFPKKESLTNMEEAVSQAAAQECDNFVAMETGDLMDENVLDDADIEATLAENIVDYGIFAPDPLLVDDTALCAQDAIKTEQVEREEEEIIREAPAGFVENENGVEAKVNSAIKSILKAELEDEEENCDERSSSSLS